MNMKKLEKVLMWVVIVCVAFLLLMFFLLRDTGQKAFLPDRKSNYVKKVALGPVGGSTFLNEYTERITIL